MEQLQAIYDQLGFRSIISNQKISQVMFAEAEKTTEVFSQMQLNFAEMFQKLDEQDQQFLLSNLELFKPSNQVMMKSQAVFHQAYYSDGYKKHHELDQTIFFNEKGFTKAAMELCLSQKEGVKLLIHVDKKFLPEQIGVEKQHFLDFCQKNQDYLDFIFDRAGDIHKPPHLDRFLAQYFSAEDPYLAQWWWSRCIGNKTGRELMNKNRDMIEQIGRASCRERV